MVDTNTESTPLADPRKYLADIPSSLVSGVLGMMAFVLACVVGLIAQNPPSTILLRAIVAMLVGAIVGRILGQVGEVCIREYVRMYQSKRPQPVRPKELLELEQRQFEHDLAVEHMKKSGEK